MAFCFISPPFTYRPLNEVMLDATRKPLFVLCESTHDWTSISDAEPELSNEIPLPFETAATLSKRRKLEGLVVILQPSDPPVARRSWSFSRDPALRPLAPIVNTGEPALAAVTTVSLAVAPEPAPSIVSRLLIATFSE